MTTREFKAQQSDKVCVMGTLSFKSGEVVVGANVLAISPTKNTVITYSISDKNGVYCLQIPATYRQVIISVNSLVCEDTSKMIQNTNQHLDFILKEKEIELREVTVTAPKVWGSSDTINYSVLQLSRSNDKTISDVLRNIPGVKVEPSGMIRYQGKPISQLYIEGIDLSQGRYALITENISNKDISTIQILNNHNHIKALQNIRPSDDVAINLKIAQSKQGIWATNAMLGLGYDGHFLTNSKLASSYITRLNQHLIVGSIDNSGNPTGNELKRFGKHRGILVSEDQKPIASVRKGPKPPITPEAYVDNFTTYVSENSCFSLGEDSQLKLSIDYLYNKEFERSSMFSKFYGVSGLDAIETFEVTHSNEKTHKFSGSLDFEINKTQKFFTNHFSGCFEKDIVTGVVLLDGDQNIVQHQNFEHYHIKNYARYLVKESSVPFDVMSISQYKSGFENFEVSLSQPVNILQFARHILFNTDNFVSIPDVILGRGWRYTPVLQVACYNHSIMVNKKLSRDGLFETSARQDFSFLNNRTTIRLSLPIHYRRRTFDNLYFTNWSIEPSFKLKQDISYKWQIVFDVNYKERLPHLIELYPEMFYLDYRTKIENKTKIYQRKKVSTDVKINHNNFMSLLSTYLKIAYRYEYSPVLASYFAIDNNSLKMKMLPINNCLYSWNLESSISKGFIWKNLGVTLLLGYSNIQGQTALKDRVRNYTNQVSAITANIKFNPSRKIILDYGLQLTDSKFTIKKEHSYDNFIINHALSLGGDILPNCFCDISMDHTYFKYLEAEKHFVLLGTSLKYRQPKWDLGFKITNLMNTRYYTLITNYEYGNFITANQLRSRAFMLTLNIKI